MVKNEDVVKSFVNGLEDTKTPNLFIEKNINNGVLILYSYGHHFPLGIKLLDNTFLININGYSNTTARHKSILCYELKNCNFKQLALNKHDNILLFDTQQLKKIIDLGFKNKCEIIQNKI